MAVKLTQEQQSAVDTRGSALLVSAAAGSGKTRVLVERVLSAITDPIRPQDIGAFLIITYTRAAAAELKERIRDAIDARLALEPDNLRLRRQSALSYAAPIGTIHSFCTELLRENAHLVDLTPDFRVADDTESALIKTRVLDDLLNARYDAITDGSDFALLVDTMSAGRDDSKLVGMVLDAHAKLKSHEDPVGWARAQRAMLELQDVTDASETLWGRYLMDEARRAVVYWRGVLDDLLDDMQVHPDFDAAYGPSINASLDGITRFLSALDGGWDDARTSSAVEFPRAKNIKGYDEFKQTRTRCRDAIRKIAGVFEASSADLLEDIAAVAPAARALLELVLDFDENYAQEKRQRGLIDFSDQEHLTAQLLTDLQTGSPTALARAVSERYTEILVDEYQDVNRVQERIFRAVSRDGQNIFMVGDVKQSIYRFRMADPSIFLNKYRSYRAPSDAGDGEGVRLILPDNFRSRAPIIDAVNFLFANVMSERFGEMAYTPAEYLYPGRVDAGDNAPPVELDIIDMSSDDADQDNDGDSPGKTAVEAAFVADRIASLVDEGMLIPDSMGGQRPLTYGDCAILLRSVKNKAAIYADALQRRGIAVNLDNGEGYFETVEVSVALSYLDIIDNPMQDVPLLTVLTSPLYGFTPDELASIRTADRRCGLYEALVKSADKMPRCRSFLEDLKALRQLAPDVPTDTLIFRLYNKTQMLAVFGALHGGENRRNNLMRLMRIAGQYENSGYKGLYLFMTFVRRMIENGDEPAQAAAAPTGSGVKILSIHKSKGLEFPVVFLSDTAKRFNKTDAAKPVLMHAQLGVGVKRTELERRIEYTTLPRMAVAKKLAAESMAEELRVLYVALTRAREKLIITAAFADAERELKRLTRDAVIPVAPQVLEGARSQSDFILLPVLTRPEADCLREGDAGVYTDDGSAWYIRRVKASDVDIAQRATAPVENPAAAAPNEQDVEETRRSLSYQYPYQQAQELPSKLTATELKGRFTDLESSEDAEKPKFLAPRSILYDRPAFITEQTGLTAAERGTALHLAMQYIDYASCADVQSTARALDDLEARGFLSAAQRQAVAPEKIVTFFSSELGRRVLSAEKLYREFKFSLLVPASDYYDNGEDDEILLQGVIDVAFVENGMLTILDFKTDRVTSETLDDKARLYADQVRAYGMALTRITGLPVDNLILYFFDLQSAVTIAPTASGVK